MAHFPDFKICDTDLQKIQIQSTDLSCIWSDCRGSRNPIGNKKACKKKFTLHVPFKIALQDTSNRKSN